ncbi:hypothetical protein [Methanobrevibacter curvatus]|uniref:Uncharacterized protein n=1 Tax=Methanobrevibacter curvatus TaxID=49547 RepID=A0A166CBB5_9EURY|nr:hypothetical protein [Methanobrevibacter curvatus]KZX12837.1 hypothetical protein MBCUR_08930 [Methanobrevibacter curvatus]
MNVIKEEILEKINDSLKEYPASIDGITMISFSEKKSYIGNIKFLDMEKVEEAKKILSKVFKCYGHYSIHSQEVVSCCAPKYMTIGFKIDVEEN